MIYNKKVLPNGLRIITVPMKDSPTVTALVLVEAGSKYETKKNNGISHFLEHMCFKGTEKRPQSILISRELDSIGSQYNAFTGQEYTGYYAKSDFRHFDKIFDVVSDIYLNSTFPEKEMEKEKGVIIEEINMYQDLPQRHVQDLFMELLYGDQPAGWNIAGPRENIKKMARKNFTDYRREHYLAPKTLVVVAGNIDEEKVLKAVEEKFAGIPKGEGKPKKKVSEKQKKPEIKIEYKKTDQTHLVLGVRSFNAYDKKDPAMTVLAGVLSGGMSSRLFQKIREEMGVAYYIRAESDEFTDHGFLQVSAGVDNKRLGEVISAILGELKSLKENLVDGEELKKVKDYLIGGMYLGLESSDSLAEFYGGQEVLRKNLKTPGDIAEEIKKVTAEDIKKVAGEIFTDEKLNLALIGPVKTASGLTNILHF